MQTTTATTTMQIQIPMSIIWELRSTAFDSMNESGLTVAGDFVMPTRTQKVGRGESMVMFCTPDQVDELINELDWVGYAHSGEYYEDPDRFLSLSARKVAKRLRAQMVRAGHVPCKPQH